MLLVQKRFRKEAEARVSESLLEKIASGHRSAVSDCVNRYGGLVWSLARRFTATQADAEDAVQEIFISLWKSAERFDSSKSSEMTFVAMIARRLPRLKILMNHLAGSNVEGGPADPEWVKGIQAVAKYPNVYCKISGLYQQSHRQPSPTDVEFYKPTLDVLTEAFGEDRLIYGSNWPVTMRGGTYGDYKQVVLDYFGPKGRSFVEKLMYQNALKFYGLPDLKP